jgi:hypothetical protein
MLNDRPARSGVFCGVEVMAAREASPILAIERTPSPPKSPLSALP